MRPGIRSLETRQPYQNYFSVTEQDIQVPRFDGGISDVVTRAAFVSGDAVAVLPYDAKRDRVLLIEQFRFAPHVNGDKSPWKLEAVAGRIDPGETPQQTARREMHEETGLEVGQLIPVASYYPAPGAVTEYMYAFVGLVDLPDGSGGIAGLQQEAEDIKSHVLDFAEAQDLIAIGAVDTGPLITALFWLSLHRDNIRKGA